MNFTGDSTLIICTPLKHDISDGWASFALPLIDGYELDFIIRCGVRSPAVLISARVVNWFGSLSTPVSCRRGDYARRSVCSRAHEARMFQR
jgi:hypothetical protein